MDAKSVHSKNAEALNIKNQDSNKKTIQSNTRNAPFKSMQKEKNPFEALKYEMTIML